MKVIISPEARTDMRLIREYISQDNPGAASRLPVELLFACDRLEAFPERGRLGQRTGTRELTSVWPYVITYRIKGEIVEVLRIWHGRQHRGR